MTLLRTDLSNAEKKAYIQAELCLINSPPKNGLGDARSIFEELQWTHLEQTDSIHGVVGLLTSYRLRRKWTNNADAFEVVAHVPALASTVCEDT